MCNILTCKLHQKCCSDLFQEVFHLIPAELEADIPQIFQTALVYPVTNDMHKAILSLVENSTVVPPTKYMHTDSSGSLVTVSSEVTNAPLHTEAFRNTKEYLENNSNQTFVVPLFTRHIPGSADTTCAVKQLFQYKSIRAFMSMPWQKSYTMRYAVKDFKDKYDGMYFVHKGRKYSSICIFCTESIHRLGGSSSCEPHDEYCPKKISLPGMSRSHEVVKKRRRGKNAK